MSAERVAVNEAPLKGNADQAYVDRPLRGAACSVDASNLSC